MIKKKRKSNKYVFTLKGIDIGKIDEKYGINLISNLKYSENVPHNATKLIDINLDKPIEIISFLDESKKLYQCNISMVDFNTGNQTKTLNYNCYWCHHPFTSYPIGCPIKYVSNKATKKYHSEITKDIYVIKENITSKKSNRLQNDSKYTPFNFFLINDNNNMNNIDIKNEQYFYTDGIFCSFNCCKAFIKENKHNKLYNYSEILLTKLFNHIMKLENKSEDLKVLKIIPAPHWRLLQIYGGHLSINKFRENFNKITYNFHGIINKDIFKPIGHLYEEKINF